MKCREKIIFLTSYSASLHSIYQHLCKGELFHLSFPDGSLFMIFQQTLPVATEEISSHIQRLQYEVTSITTFIRTSMLES